MLKTSTWDDPAFRELGPDGRLIFLWSWTNPDAAIGGLYHASLRQIARALSDDAPLERAERALRGELAAKPMIVYDFEQEMLWVVTRAAHANRSPKVAVAIMREWERCAPASDLKAMFAVRYPHLATP